MKDLEKVVELFMEENDVKALEKLYKITNDEIVKVLLEWNDVYAEQLESPYSYSSEMYEDVMGYVWNKYKLNEVEFDNDMEY